MMEASPRAAEPVRPRARETVAAKKESVQSSADQFREAKERVEDADKTLQIFLEDKKIPLESDRDDAYLEYLLCYQDQALAYAAAVGEVYAYELNRASESERDPKRAADALINKAAVSALLNRWRAEIREPAASYEALAKKTEEALWEFEQIVHPSAKKAA